MHNLQPTNRYWIIALLLLLGGVVYGQYHIKPFDISKHITALEQGDDGYLLYGTRDGEFGTFDGLQFNRIDQISANIHTIEREEDRTFLCTSKGLYELKNNELTLISRNNLNVLARSRDNTILVTESGVYNKMSTDYFPNQEEFYLINDIEKGAFFTLGMQEFFRADSKVFTKKNNRWVDFLNHRDRDFEIIPWNSSKMILADSSGVMALDKDGYLDTLLRQDAPVRSKIFKLNNTKALLCQEDNIGIFNLRTHELDNFYALKTSLISDAVRDDWGNIWITAGSFIYQIIDRSATQIKEPPKIVIESIRINGIEKALKPSYRLDVENNEIEIDFSGVHMTDPRNLEFQTMLTTKKQNHTNGNTQTWSAPSKSRNIEYRNLQPGRYTFQLRASVDGKYFMYSEPIVFDVESDYFQSVWLMGILGAFLILLIALFFNYRYNNFKQKSDLDRERLIQENKVLTLQQKALQLQMNPHFVFNSLNSIQGLIANEENQKARRYLREFSTMMRSVLNQSREETILIADEIKYLKSYLNLEQMANNSSFDYEVVTDQHIEDDMRIPTMIIQPFVENAILHGVKSLQARRGKIELNFKLEGTKICCTITDNGIGRTAAASVKSAKHRSVAIDVVAERLRSKLSQPKAAPIQYRDLKNEEGQATGTEVRILIPIMN